METDHEQLHRDLESQGDNMQERRDGLKEETDTARHDVQSKVSDERVPGLQDEQEDVIHGREAVEQRQQSDEDESDEEEGADASSEEDGEDAGGGSQGAGYREGEE